MGVPMTQPIVARPPETVRLNYDGTGSLWYEVHRRVQPAPYNVPAPFLRRFVRTTFAEKSANVEYGGMANANTGKAGVGFWVYAFNVDWSWPEVQAIASKVRSKLVDKVSSRAEMGTNLAERKQAMTMITSRLTQLLRFTNKIRRFDLVGAGHELGLGNPRAAARRVSRALKAKQKAKTFSNLWLEYHFGWSPLLSDIHNAYTLLDEPINDRPLVVKGTLNGATPWNYTQSDWNGNYFVGRASHTWRVRCSMGCSVRVDNPNLALAERMGLTNPALIAWELVPFSFVVDWFVNVSDYLGQFTDFAGVTLVDPWNAAVFEDVCGSTQVFVNPDSPQYSYQIRINSVSFLAERWLGLPSVSLGARPPWRLSPTRALTSISLLIQKLR